MNDKFLIKEILFSLTAAMFGALISFYLLVIQNPYAQDYPLNKQSNQDVSIKISDSTHNPAKVENFIYLDELKPLMVPARFFINRWNSPKYTGKFKMNGSIYERGIGLYIISSGMKNATDSVELEYSLNRKYKKLMFDLGTEQEWCAGDKYGKFMIEVMCDGELSYSSGKWCDYNYFTKISIDITDCEKLMIVLHEMKGPKGTLNVIMGDVKLFYY